MQKVFENRCDACYGTNPWMKNVRLGSPALVKRHAQPIRRQVVVTVITPMNNATGITEAKRVLLKARFEAGRSNAVRWPTRRRLTPRLILKTG